MNIAGSFSFRRLIGKNRSSLWAKMELHRQRIFFVGGGNMASAIISALDYKLWHITVAEVSEPARIVCFSTKRRFFLILQAISTRFPRVRILSSLDNKQDLQVCLRNSLSHRK